MKRSKVIREIKSIIATCGPTQPTIETAEKVLSRLESLGMLPPEYLDRKRDIRILDWEPENDIKTFCKDCGIETKPDRGSARCPECWNDKTGA